ncbi:MAG TPA: peptidase [Thermoanaerobaculia bacterium]|nr:peptidase [Thermoanaerobaculia bacterium]
MKRVALLPMIALAVACQTTTTPPASSTPVVPATSAAAKLAVAPDTPARLAQLPRTVIDYDRSLLNENERQVVSKLVEASKLIEEIYWRQVAEENVAVRTQLEKQAGQSPLDRAGYDCFVANKGRWDRLDQNVPFIAPFGPAGKKPDGSGFYPTDLTKEELEKYVAAHPDQKDALQGLLTVVRRDGAALKAIPYSKYYADKLVPAAQKLREAAALTTNEALRTYLTKCADAFLSDNYRESDMAWMDLAGPIEVVIGPYEVYEDDLFNYKASFESFVTVVDKPESEKLAVYAKHLSDMERDLPEPEEYKNPNRGSDSPIRVVQEIFTAGDARRGVQTAAFNLPNDEFVREKKGSKKVLLKNVMDAKFRQSGKPIALRVLDPSQVDSLSFDAFFNHVLFHELSHALGPGYVTLPGGERVEARIPLKNLYSTIEECKADVLGIWNILYAQKHGLVTAFDEKQLLVTYAGLMFRSTRFGVAEAHGRGTAVQWNWLREKEAIVPTTGGRYRVDLDKMRDGVKSLATELLTIEATGNFDRAKALIEKYGKETPEMAGVNALLKNIPVDITPVFVGAGEKP